MPVERFFDTNILLYAYDLDCPSKRDVAQGLIKDAWQLPDRTAFLRKISTMVRITAASVRSILSSSRAHET